MKMIPMGMQPKIGTRNYPKRWPKNTARGGSLSDWERDFIQNPKNFVYGISQGESVWFTNFENSDLWVQLNLRAQDMSALRWNLIYEHKGLRAAFEQDKKAREKGSL